MDEATIRIRLDGGRRPGPGGASGTAPGAAPPPAGRTPPVPQVDPYAQVRKRQTRETTDTLDAVAAMTKQFRSQLGGVFGGLLGAVLDMATGWRDVQKTISQRMPSGGFATVPGRLPTGAELGLVRQRGPADERTPDVLAAVEKAAAERYARQAAKPQAPGTIQYPGPNVILNKPPQTFAEAQAGTPATRAGLARNRAMTEEPQSMAALARRKALQTAPVQTVPEPGLAPMTAAGIASAAAGPLAIVGAVIAGMMVLKAVSMSAADAIGGLAVAASNPSVNPSQAFVALGAQVTKTTENFIYVGNLLGVLGPVVGRTIETFGRVMDNLSAVAQRYAEFSPRIARAEAESEIRQVLGELRRSRQLETQISAYIDAQSKFQQSFEDLKVRVLVTIVPTFTTVITKLDQILQLLPGATADTRPINDPLEMQMRAQLADDLGTEGVNVP